MLGFTMAFEALPPLTSDIGRTGVEFVLTRLFISTAAVFGQRVGICRPFIDASIAFHACTEVEFTLNAPLTIWYCEASK